ncbi:O-antigen ligase [bacterium]|nr:O-antigen ligase [bacterium]
MTFMFVALFILFPLVAFTLLQFSGFSIMRVGLVQFVVLALFFFSFIGTLPLYFGLDEYRVNTGVTDQVLVIKVMLFSGYTMILFVLGALSSKSVFNVTATLNSFNKVRINRKEVLFLLLLFIFVLLVLSIYLSKIPRIALLVALLENVQESKVARSMMGNDFSGKYHWYSFAIHDLANLITFSFFGIYLLARRRVYFLLFVISFSVSAFTALMATEKGPFAWLLIGLFLVYVLASQNGRFPIKLLVSFFGVVFLLIALSYMFFMGINDLGQAFLSLFSRAFAGSVQPAYHYLEFFPAHHEYLWGASFPNPGGILPYQPFALTQEVMNWAMPSGIENGIVGSMPTVFWGEAYANFGYYGIIFMPFLMGVFIFTVDYYLNKIIVTPLKIGLYVWLLLHYKGLAVTGFSGFVIDFYFALLIVLFLTIVLLSNKFRIHSRKTTSVVYE